METHTTTQDASRGLRRRGAVILAVFAVLWAAVAASGLDGGAASGVRAAGVLVCVGVVALTFGRRDDPAAERVRDQPAGWHRRVGRVNLLQLVAIAVIVAGGVGTGRPELVPPSVCLVVGLHFVPLARLFDQPQYTWTAIGLCVAAVAGLLVLAVVAPAASRVVVGLGAAATLWATAGHLALRR